MIMNYDEFKTLLEKERGDIEESLKEYARKSINEETGVIDWIPLNVDTNVPTAEKGDMAEQAEQYETSFAIEKKLEERWSNIVAALKRIEEGTYGKCTVGGGDIPEDRLKANPAASTCINHS